MIAQIMKLFGTDISHVLLSENVNFLKELRPCDVPRLVDMGL